MPRQFEWATTKDWVDIGYLDIDIQLVYLETRYIDVEVVSRYRYVVQLIVMQ